MDVTDEFRPLRDARIWALRGAGFVVLFIFTKLLLLGLPFGLLFALSGGRVSQVDPLVVITVCGAAVLGGALSGAAYGAFGRPLRARGKFGDYAAGAVIATPYFFVMIRAVASARSDLALLRPLDRIDLIVLAFAALYIGPLIGHFNLPRLEPERFPRAPT